MDKELQTQENKRIISLINQGKINTAIKTSSINSINSLIYFSRAYLQAGEDSLAIRFLKRIAELDPKIKEIWWNLGIIYRKNKEFDDAIICIIHYLTLNPNDIDALNLLGFLYNEKGEHIKAINNLDIALKLNPDYADAWLNKGVALNALTKYFEAIDCFNKVLEIVKEPDPTVALALSNKGVSYNNLGQNDESIAYLDRSLRLNPDFAVTWYNKSVTLEDLGKFDEALSCLQNAIKIDNNYRNAWFNKGGIFHSLNNYEEALKCYDRCIELNKKDEKSWYNKGHIFVSVGNFPEAIKCLKRSLQLNHNKIESNYLLGFAYRELKDYKKSLECFESGLKIDDKIDMLWLGKGDTYAQIPKPKYDEAIKCYDKANECNPDNEVTWYNRGNTLSAISSYDEAIRSFENAIQLNHHFAAAHGNMGIAYLNKHNYIDAKIELELSYRYFLEQHDIKSAERMHKCKVISEHSFRTRNRIHEFEAALNRIYAFVNSFSELKEEHRYICRNYVEKFKITLEKIPLFYDVHLVLFYIVLCSNELTNLLKGNKEIKSDELKNAEKIFKEYGQSRLLTTVNFIEKLAASIKQFDSIGKIPKETEHQIFNNLNRENEMAVEKQIEFSCSIQPLESEEIVINAEMFPKIKNIDITQLELNAGKKPMTRFCLVQLDYNLISGSPDGIFCYELEEKDLIKKKVLQALEIARSKNVNLIAFPELSVDKKWINEIMTSFREMIIVFGSYYDNGYNICPILINGKVILYRKTHASISETPIAKHGIKTGDSLYVLRTTFGNLLILICIDYTYESLFPTKCCMDIDVIVNPCLEEKIQKSQKRCDCDCREYNFNIILVNKADSIDGLSGSLKFGGSCVIAREHKIILDRLKESGIKPKDDIEYKLCQLEGEQILIVDMDMKNKSPQAPTPVTYLGRIKIVDRFLQSDNRWVRV